MGNYMNKLLLHADESRRENETQTIEHQQISKEDNKLFTPIRSEGKLLIDPRSASLGIRRTPILVDSTPVGVSKRIPNAIPKHLQKKQYLETNLDMVIAPCPPWSPKKNFMAKCTVNIQSEESDKIENSSILNATVVKTPKNLTAIEKERYRILGLDPRSPAADFNRTPILIPKSLAMIKARSQDNLNRKGSYETDVYNPRNSWQEASISLDNTEIQLLPDIASKRLRELDSETRAELNIFHIPDSDFDSSVFTSEEDLTVIKNSKFKITNDKSLITSERTLTTTDKREGSTSGQNDYKDVIEENMKAIRIKDDNKIKIWHDSSISEESVLSKVEEEEVRENIKGELSQKKMLKEDICDEHTAKNSSPSKLINIENIQKKEDVGENVRKILKSDVKFKSDEKKIFSPDSKYSNEAPKNRTPLSNRSNNGKTQGIPAKSPQQSLKNKTVAKIQQENTPPYKNYNAKTRSGIQWDPNSSVVI
ncbi:PREDICTED: uncharacterized protein LOC106746956 [Dinoponera quadriceps]|uniref:Uncharacterized protein LOC106746956 n=1 Tax=Dinoponera quadriceps TaxID=609295 RepID=A0A6P3XME4_DINQU|nr:PREDICTED: uncharacterized protein LOC106746956 [Dinoponera quadriceps]XP_014479633.1 PREDICTED: uncharacterized protein LOC106746956 [Dinoponera quadriceps]XP_014479635.1 PREDICTED: uncharacterized protein LOC106746956 [Dinoponera quadriceps]